MLGTGVYGWGREYNTSEVDRKLGECWEWGLMGGGGNIVFTLAVALIYFWE